MAKNKRYRFNALAYMRRNHGHGNFVVLRGPIRKGKTYLAALWAREYIRGGFKVISNIRWKPQAQARYPGRLFYVSTDRQFFEAYRDNEGPFIVIFDDAQTYGMVSTAATSKKGKQITDLSLFVGKLEMSCVFIEHLKYVPEFIKGQNPLTIYKLEQESFYVPKRPGLFVEDMRSVRQQSIRFYIDKSQPIPYETLMVPSFDITLPLSELWSYLAGRTGAEHDLRAGVREFLELLDKRGEDEALKLTWEEIWGAIRAKVPDVRPTWKLYDIIPNKVLYNDKTEE